MVPEEMMSAMAPEGPPMEPSIDPSELGGGEPDATGENPVPEPAPGESEEPKLDESEPVVAWAEAKAELMERWGVKPSKFGVYLDNIGLTEDELRKLVMNLGHTPAPEEIREAALRKAYRELWGEEPPDGVVKEAVGMGMNRRQFERTQRADPAWKDTDAFKQKKKEFVRELDKKLWRGE